MQDGLIIPGFWEAVEGYKPSGTDQLKQDKVKAFYDRLDKAGVTDKIHFNGDELNEVDFKGARFFCQSSFSGSVTDGVNFSDTTFFKFVMFRDIHPIEFANHSQQIFTFTFCRATFAHGAYFGNSTFDQLFFTDAKFEEMTRFHTVSVRYEFSLLGAQFAKRINFWNCEFKERLNWGLCVFKKDMTLGFDDDATNSKFTLNMRGATFENHPPALFGSNLNPDSDLACILPKVPSTSHINIYEDLRQHAERLGKLDDRKRFVHAELSCRAIDPNKSGAERFIWLLYGLTSNYGTSVYLPLFWLLILFLISAAPWMGYAIWFSSMSVWSALSYNILQAVPFTGHLSSALLNNFHELPMSLHFIAGPIALLNPIFWFLTGLGLRFQLRLAR